MGVETGASSHEQMMLEVIRMINASREIPERSKRPAIKACLDEIAEHRAQQTASATVQKAAGGP